MRFILYLLFLAPNLSLAADSIFLVEFKSSPTSEQINQIQSIAGVKSFTRMSPYKSDYFDRVYELHTQILDRNANEDLIFKLKKSALVNRIEKSKEFDIFSVIPTKENASITNDYLFNYQWNLHNSSQTITNDIDDTHPMDITGVHGYDLGWIEYYKNYESKIKHDLRVAVIDSGVKISMEEIKGQIYKNKSECRPDGNPDPNSKSDLDKNGYIGDCKGMDFSDPDQPNGNNIVSNDEFGHGTANAGIISAAIDNKTGIAGISNKIKIIPIKVIRKNQKPQKDPETCSIVPQKNPYSNFVHNVAKGILYAITMKADVINLSLGWPSSANTLEIQEALNEAHKNNIIVVAAAGNNNNNVPIYPCLNRNVICVGGTMANGEMSYNSNYGGFVDTVAPGNNILTINPLNSLNFMSGYGVVSGTSQAAPHIAALAAILKGLYPQITLDEIRARIFASGGTFKTPKYVLSGQPKLNTAIEANPQTIIRPIFKDQSSIYFKLENSNKGSFAFDLPIKNYWVKSQNIKIIVRSLNNAVALTKNNFIFSELKPSQEVLLHLAGSISNLYESRDLDITVEILENNRSLGVYKNHYYLTRNLDNDPDVVKIPFGNTEVSLTQIRTVPSYFNVYDKPEYFVREIRRDKTTHGVQLSLFKYNNFKFEESSSIYLENATNLLYFLKIDLNYDGKPDYLISYIELDCSTERVFLQYLDSNLKPLQGLPPFELKSNPQKYEIAKLSTSDKPPAFLAESDSDSLRFLRSPIDGYGYFAMPIFFENGRISNEDQSPDPTKVSSSKGRRIYYYEPILSPSPQIVVRTYINYNVIEKLQNELPVKFRDSLALVNMLPQSETDFINGKISLFIAWTKDRILQQSILEVDNDLIHQNSFILHNLDFSIPGLEYYKLTETINLDSLNPNNKLNFSLSIPLTAKLANTSIFKLNGLIPQFVYTFDTIPFDTQNKFQGLIASFFKNNMTYAFFATNNKILLNIFDGRSQKQYEQDIIRSTFYLLFSTENLIPVVRGKYEKEPAIYVDATAISTRHVYIWTLKNEKLVAPALMNVHIPSNCKSLDPEKYGENGAMSYFVFCQEGNNFSIRTLPIE